jgi:nucleoside-diphosphate-sugar epimerase
LRCCVTGAAGFIGSHLSEALIRGGHTVVGIDCFTPYYGRAVKERNLGALSGLQAFELAELDLRRDDLGSALAGVEWVFHEAGQPGVRPSWGNEFAEYDSINVLGTQRLLEGMVQAGVAGLVYASSSSIYGNAERLPTGEDVLPQPISPYGVTKLAAEHLCRSYGLTHRFPVAALRYFTVYGPRQRPDMGFHRFIDAVLHERTITVYGDGRQTRDFTFVADAVAANVAAMTKAADGLFNIGGGSRVELLEVLQTIERAAGKPARLEFGPPMPGDARHTAADTTAARERLGYAPSVSLEQGIAAQVAWQRG